MAKIYKIAIVFIFLGMLPLVAEAATLYFSPSSGAYTVGGTLSVNVYVSSADQAMNAASGVISFPQDKLEVTSLSKTGSIFILWVQEPSFLNSVGTINFEGIVLNPGFTGAAGKIITTNFKVKAAGVATLNFSSGSVLANDGKGTNILANMNSGTYTLKPVTITPPAEEILPEEEYVAPPTVGVPAAPVVSSPTHPDENKWYSNNDPEFSWKLPSDVDGGVSIYFSKSPTSNPGPLPDGLFSTKSYENVEDGIWYFHIKLRNSYGWGPITHRKVLIDTTPPLPFEIDVQREDPTDPQPILNFETTDELSGIEYYEMKIGEGEPFPAEKIKTKSYKLPPQAPGEHPIELKVYDKARNFVLASTNINVLPIETPKITKFPTDLTPGQNLTLEGESLPEAIIEVFVQKKGEKEPTVEETKAEGEGNWSFVSSKALEKGDYEAWVEAQDKRGALSYPTEKLTISVNLPPFIKFGTMAISYFMIMATLIVLIATAIIIIFYTWYRISLWRKRLRTETKELSQAIYGAFKALREEVQEQIEYLDKKPGVTESEKKVRDKLKEALDVSEQFIDKELKDVEKELE
ncbi:hypothetical protein COV54_01295 [Candidatus Jorgensenbacteria bacterium CG11_big_fil_rev_8_21_14_0_20_38_23]|uniref:Bacterial Ig-like domain-containing protein n=1 Tax=Candidatus Jorgensenbacteria bacterium CG11_big_fil_rev_8_21_14_0_20_38_23 TaxID=1974594 RepID=A0A2H0NES2_9BACT|nr:MAG: hypothetical protein COV54_01295 [Candidatus Jorgensenbacteria bacterium CG11_big_fil_rev_8_21_14_0_20_38_23]